LQTPLKALTETLSHLNQATSPIEAQRLVALAANISVQMQTTMTEMIKTQSSTPSHARLEKLALINLVEKCIERNYSFADIYHCTIKLFAPQNHWQIKADCYSFDQALSYLLQQAIKNAAQQSLIRVVIQEDQSGVKISVVANPKPAILIGDQRTAPEISGNPADEKHLQALADAMFCRIQFGQLVTAADSSRVISAHLSFAQEL
jgi:K+-sensing histidine kinase KdpD